jgi:hypothetical protein
MLAERIVVGSGFIQPLGSLIQVADGGLTVENGAAEEPFAENIVLLSGFLIPLRTLFGFAGQNCPLS